MKRIASYAGRVALRRVVVVIVGLVLAYFGLNDAHAHDFVESNGTGRVYAVSQSEAWAACEASRAQAQAEKPTWGYFVCEYSATATVTKTFNGVTRQYEGEIRCRAASSASTAKYSCNYNNMGFSAKSNEFWWRVGVQCPESGQTYDPVTHACTAPGPTEEDCLNRNDAINGPGVVGATNACVDGCRVGPKPGGDHKLTTFTSGTVSASIFSGEVGFTGETCSAPSEPMPDLSKPQECAMAGDGQTMCVKPDGMHCYATSSSNVTQHCWRPGETGTKTDGNRVQKREAGDKTANPTPPNAPEGDTLSQVGDPKKSTTIINGDVVTTTTTNYQTGSGAEAGPPGGEPGDGTGGEDGDGDDAGSVGGDVTLDRMTGADARTPGSIIAAHGARIANAPLVTAATGFFDVSASGSSCPSWTIPETSYTPSVVMDFWCVSQLASAWSAIGTICLIMFGWAAFRVAVL